MRTKSRRLEIRTQRIRTVINKHCRVPSQEYAKDARHRFTVTKSGRHLYAQIIDLNSKGAVVASASTLSYRDKNYKKSFCNKNYAEKLGRDIMKSAIEKGVVRLSVDRSGHKYTGNIKAIIDSARSESQGKIAF